MNKTILENIKKIFKFQLALTIITASCYVLAAPQHIFMFVLGSSVVSLNFFALFILWKRVFDKKPVALTLGLIITKYAVLGVILYVIATKQSAQLPAFLVGVSTMIASFLLLALNIAITEKNK